MRAIAAMREKDAIVVVVTHRPALLKGRGPNCYASRGPHRILIGGSEAERLPGGCHRSGPQSELSNGGPLRQT